MQYGVYVQVLSTFAKYVLRCETAEDWDEPMATFIVGLLVDRHSEVLQVPLDVVDQIGATLRQRKLSNKPSTLRVRFFVCFSLVLSHSFVHVVYV